jgi:Uma2 family endonuclease
MSAFAKLPPWLTVAEFLRWDSGDDARYELVDGVPHAMAPGSNIHNFLQSELGALIRNHLRATRPGCEVLTNPGVVPHVLADRNFRVPDLGVTCAPLPIGSSVLPDPLLLLEILSPSNQASTWANVWTYTSIPSVQEIIILRSDRVTAELLRRGPDGVWPQRTETAPEAIELASIGLRIPLAELYARTGLLD